MKADSNTTNAVTKTINNLTDAYKTRGLDAVMECLVPDDDISLIGAGADEVRVGLALIRTQAERDWAQTDSIEMSFLPKSISAAGQVAWVFAEGAFNIQTGGQGMTLPARATSILENRSDQWLIVHAHFSTPTAGQEAGSSV
jgi:ketosteroid isomerase-like protein